MPFRATVPTHCGEIEVEAASQCDLFQAIADAVEVFDQPNCGLCKSTNIRPTCRVVDTYRFPEYVCRDCGARLKLGQAKKGGTLFPVRKLGADGMPDSEKGVHGPHNGWHHFRPEAQQAPAPQQPPVLAPKQPSLNSAKVDPPKDGCELFSRLKKVEDSLIAGGRCLTNELMEYADEEANRRGYPAELKDWSLGMVSTIYLICGAWVKMRSAGSAGSAGRVQGGK